MLQVLHWPYWICECFVCLTVRPSRPCARGYPVCQHRSQHRDFRPTPQTHSHIQHLAKRASNPDLSALMDASMQIETGRAFSAVAVIRRSKVPAWPRIESRPYWSGTWKVHPNLP
jgi:hypothetical protein